MSNPLLQELPEHGLPNFSAITAADYREAFDLGFAEHEAEVEAIAGNTAVPTFANTVEAMERAGKQLNRVMSVFSNLVLTDTNAELQALDLEISQRHAKHESHIYTNRKLFERVDRAKDTASGLDEEQAQLLQRTHRQFVRAGAQLDAAERERMQNINGELARLTTQFSQNVLIDTNAYQLLLDEDQLSGLPAFVREVAAAEADSKDQPGKFLFTLSRSSITPFLQYSGHRELREDIYRAYTRCGSNTVDNSGIIRQIVALRAERASLLGYASHADYMLEDRMAGAPAKVNDLLQQVWAPCRNLFCALAKGITVG